MKIMPSLPQERVQNRILDPIVDIPVSQNMEAAVEVLHAPQECVQNRTPEQIVDMPVPSVLEAVVEVDAPLSQDMEEPVQAVPPDAELDVHVTPDFESPEELDARADGVLAQCGRWTFEYPWLLEEALVAEVDDDDGCVEPSRFRVGFRPMRMCRQFPLGNCRYGWGCTFAHHVRELHPFADLDDV